MRIATVVGGGVALIRCIPALEKVQEGEGAFGYNAQTQVYEDLIAAGVMDPTKVVRTALQNAASVASLMITTEACIAERPKGGREAPDAEMHGGMGGMGM
jgi:chaperonin GroEL